MRRRPGVGDAVGRRVGGGAAQGDQSPCQYAQQDKLGCGPLCLCAARLGVQGHSLRGREKYGVYEKRSFPVWDVFAPVQGVIRSKERYFSFTRSINVRAAGERKAFFL